VEREPRLLPVSIGKAISSTLVHNPTTNCLYPQAALLDEKRKMRYNIVGLIGTMTNSGLSQWAKAEYSFAAFRQPAK